MSAPPPEGPPPDFMQSLKGSSPQGDGNSAAPPPSSAPPAATPATAPPPAAASIVAAYTGGAPTGFEGKPIEQIYGELIHKPDLRVIHPAQMGLVLAALFPRMADADITTIGEAAKQNQQVDSTIRHALNLLMKFIGIKLVSSASGQTEMDPQAMTSMDGRLNFCKDYFNVALRLVVAAAHVQWVYGILRCVLQHPPLRPTAQPWITELLPKGHQDGLLSDLAKAGVHLDGMAAPNAAGTGATSAAAPGVGTYTILSANVEAFRHYDAHFQMEDPTRKDIFDQYFRVDNAARVQSFAKMMADKKPDVAMLQEVDEAGWLSTLQRDPATRALMSSEYEWFFLARASLLTLVRRNLKVLQRYDDDRTRLLMLMIHDPATNVTFAALSNHAKFNQIPDLRRGYNIMINRAAPFPLIAAGDMNTDYGAQPNDLFKTNGGNDNLAALEGADLFPKAKFHWLADELPFTARSVVGLDVFEKIDHVFLERHAAVKEPVGPAVMVPDADAANRLLPLAIVESIENRAVWGEREQLMQGKQMKGSLPVLCKTKSEWDKHSTENHFSDHASLFATFTIDGSKVHHPPAEMPRITGHGHASSPQQNVHSPSTAVAAGGKPGHPSGGTHAGGPGGKSPASANPGGGGGLLQSITGMFSGGGKSGGDSGAKGSNGNPPRANFVFQGQEHVKCQWGQLPGMPFVVLGFSAVDKKTGRKGLVPVCPGAPNAKTTEGPIPCFEIKDQNLYYTVENFHMDASPSGTNMLTYVRSSGQLAPVYFDKKERQYIRADTGKPLFHSGPKPPAASGSAGAGGAPSGAAYPGASPTTVQYPGQAHNASAPHLGAPPPSNMPPQQQPYAAPPHTSSHPPPHEAHGVAPHEAHGAPAQAPSYPPPAHDPHGYPASHHPHDAHGNVPPHGQPPGAPAGAPQGAPPAGAPSITHGADGFISLSASSSSIAQGFAQPAGWPELPHWVHVDLPYGPERILAARRQPEHPTMWTGLYPMSGGNTAPTSNAVNAVFLRATPVDSGPARMHSLPFKGGRPDVGVDPHTGQRIAL